MRYEDMRKSIPRPREAALGEESVRVSPVLRREENAVATVPVPHAIRDRHIVNTQLPLIPPKIWTLTWSHHPMLSPYQRRTDKMQTLLFLKQQDVEIILSSNQKSYSNITPQIEM
jgi:hypothetical protein